MASVSSFNDPASLGYVVPPTDLDQQNAALYAKMKAMKAVCDKHPDKYKWVPNNVVPFTCPDGLDCVYGSCEYTEGGCRADSQLDYYDCERVQVPCELPTRDKCEVCVYKTHMQADGTVVTTLPPLHITDQPEGVRCEAGDNKYFYNVDPKLDKKLLQSDPQYQTTSCKNVFNPQPYLVDGKPVPCKSHVECSYDLGGMCMLYGTGDNKDKRTASGYCVDTGVGMGYLEWRKGFSQAGNAPPKDQCVQTYSQFKKWCEMPWTRPGDKPDDLSESVAQRVQRHPQVRAHPPFYYDDYSGRCYITKEYCKAAVENGGYETSFGKQKDYLMGFFSDCKYPDDHKAAIRDGYDCCTPAGQSIGQFFVGKNLFSDIRDFTHGRMNFAELLASNPTEAYTLLYYLSDQRLKENVQLVHPNFGGPGIHGYTFTWSPLAQQLYPHLTGGAGVHAPRPGLLAAEVAQVYPESVVTDENGFCFIAIEAARVKADAAYARVANALLLVDAFAHQTVGAQNV